MHVPGFDRAIGRVAVKRPHKYGAKPTTVDGIRFASKKEAKRYGELLMLVKAGQISELELQPSYPIIVRTHDSRSVEVAVYRADFRYRRLSDGELHRRVTEDVKGIRTETYRLKKKLVEAIYGITIVEI